MHRWINLQAVDSAFVVVERFTDGDHTVIRKKELGRFPTQPAAFNYMRRLVGLPPLAEAQPSPLHDGISSPAIAAISTAA